MSRLTVSYFTCWTFFDACSPPDGSETIGTTIFEIGASFGMHTELLRVIRLMQQSRMGIYLHEGVEEGVTVLRDLATGSVRRCLVPAGYTGETGQIWYARVLPPPLPTGSEHIVFTTPYILLATPLAKWEAYFSRVLPDAPPPARADEAERHMKYGRSLHYWNEFVFEGYVNYAKEAVFLAGLPDISGSRPHSDAYRPPSP